MAAKSYRENIRRMIVAAGIAAAAAGKPPVAQACDDCGADLNACTCKNMGATAAPAGSASEGEHEIGVDSDLRRIVADTVYAQAVNESISSLGGYATLVGLYWYCADYHGGQDSVEYSLLSQLGEIYHPAAAESGPEPDSTDEMAYEMFGGDSHSNESNAPASAAPSEDPFES